jgi:fermentation-respiration switch protein FrsA (DUF1100 family)
VWILTTLAGTVVLAGVVLGACLRVGPSDAVGRRREASTAPSRPATTGTTGVTTSPSSSSTSSTTTTTEPTTTTTTTVPSLVASPRVGSVTLTFAHRSTGLILPTVILYPARTGSRAAVSPGAQPVPGAHPLIVFAHGFLALPSTYSALLDYWARAGFVVAAPIFPDTSARSPHPEETGIVHQPADVSFVISSLLAQSRNRSSPLWGLISPQAIGVAGHSDGGDTVVALGYNSCCQDRRVKAVADLSGAEWPGFPPSWFQSGGPPLLVVQGSDDDVNLPEDSKEIYESDPGPKYFLSLLGGGHWSPYSDDTQVLKQQAARTRVPLGQVMQLVREELPVVARTTTDFFEAELLGRTGAGRRMAADGNVAGVATLTLANTGKGQPGP